MASLNKVFLMGNLTRDPDLRTTPSGASVCEFGLAVNRRFTVNGSERDETCFVDITVWSKAAENCKRFLEKGSPVLIEGRLQLDQWDDREGGGKRSKLRVVAEQVQFLNSRRDGEGAPAPRNEGGYQQRGNYSRSSYNNQPGGYGNGGRQQPPPMPGNFAPDNGSAEEDIPF
ncbi:MAG: single-stranded DNA-binding protein [Lentisphaeria bacterium]|nr:single-stranded DNA-binding protein [Lentisphaeria bacterium]